jgi:ferredoxin
MKHVSLEQFSDLHDLMTITQSIDSGFAITHAGHIEGAPTIIISTCRGGGDCYIIQ